MILTLNCGFYYNFVEHEVEKDDFFLRITAAQKTDNISFNFMNIIAHMTILLFFSDFILCLFLGLFTSCLNTKEGINLRLLFCIFDIIFCLIRTSSSHILFIGLIITPYVLLNKSPIC